MQLFTRLSLIFNTDIVYKCISEWIIIGSGLLPVWQKLERDINQNFKNSFNKINKKKVICKMC